MRLIMIMVAWVLAGLGAPAAGEQALVLSPGVHPLVDRVLIERMQGVAHVLHHPVRREVVLTMDRPWEGPMSGYGTVLRDDEGKVRLYYRGGGDIDPPEVTCVALSDDGIRFDRPELGLYEIRGTRANNVVFTADLPSYGESHNFSPFLDANPAAEEGARWKAVALKRDEDEHGERQRMLTVLGSSDGLRWKHLSERPVLRKGSFDSLNVAFFDTAGGQYVCYFRVGRDGMRSFARALSKDFISWTIDEPLEFRPAQDEQWYTNGVVAYPQVPGLFVALPMRFVPQRKTVGDPPRETDGVSDAVMMTSRDGVRWDRTFREAFIRPGADPANWGNAHGNNTPLAGIIETGDGEWSLYWFEDGVSGPPRIRRGTVRAHGLASVRAGGDEGEFITPPLRLAQAHGERSLWLNYATSAAGYVRVELLDEAGKPMAGVSVAPEMWGDDARRRVRFEGIDALPHDKPFRLRFVLRDADVYALIIE